MIMTKRNRNKSHKNKCSIRKNQKYKERRSFWWRGNYMLINLRRGDLKSEMKSLIIANMKKMYYNKNEDR